MRGRYQVRVQTKKLNYDFEIKRNITIIKGDSATGKTTLVELIREYALEGVSSGIQVFCEKECRVLDQENWDISIERYQECIFFIDEGNRFILTNEFASAVQNSNHYYVIVTREGIPSLPYSVDEIYGIRTSGKYNELKQRYHEFYRIYEEDESDVRNLHIANILTEDSNAGYQFFEDFCSERGLQCFTANGKSNVFEYLKQHSEEDLLVVADGAAFGSEMERIIKLRAVHPNIHLFLPESFEWMLLCSGLFSSSELNKILDDPSQYIDSEKYMSWERYFTNLLIEISKDTYLRYQKNNLNPAYLQDRVKKQIAHKFIIFQLSTENS